ncbi:MAG TPA: hypothetical protein VFP96_07865, partial [Candidatus Acidoferrum sp.]|nr:hypothetical protein [Candidatus Acidoferrum sp.]
GYEFPDTVPAARKRGKGAASVFQGFRCDAYGGFWLAVRGGTGGPSWRAFLRAFSSLRAKLFWFAVYHCF